MKTQPTSRSFLLTVPCAAAIGAVTAFSSPSQAIVISQTASDDSSGNANFGQEILLDSSLAAFSTASSFDLQSFTLFKGDASPLTAGQPATLFIDVYQADAAGETTPDFDPAGGTDTSGLSYLGSSVNSVGFAAATAGDALLFTFSGISLNVDRDIYLVSSTDNLAGSFQGATYEIEDDDGGGIDPVYLNITGADSDPLFGGVGDPEPKDNRYSVNVVPEPASLALLGLGGLCLLGRRRQA